VGPDEIVMGMEGVLLPGRWAPSTTTLYSTMLHGATDLSPEVRHCRFMLFETRLKRAWLQRLNKLLTFIERQGTSHVRINHPPRPVQAYRL